MADGLVSVTQSDFSAGMWRGVRPELSPPASVYNALNALYSDDGAIYRRGGSTYYSDTAFGAGLTWIWSGVLDAGEMVLIANTDDLAKVAEDGTVTTIASSAGLAGPVRPAVMDGVLYLPGGQTYDGTTLGTAAKVADYYAAVSGRLLAASGARMDFSNLGTPGTFDATDFHELPEGVEIIGLEGFRDSAALFTTGGVWIISNLAYDLTDTDGNVQHRVDQYSRDLILWGDAGIAGWGGALIVPGVDGVWLMARGVASEAAQPFQRISDPIADLYKGYVRAGYRPGGASVHQGHYLLPILTSGGDVVDKLLCRLDTRSRAWSRIGGFGGRCTAMTVKADPEAPRQPKLLGASSAGRVLELDFFSPSPSSTTDADASVYTWLVQTRDFLTSQRAVLNFVKRIRVAYELAETDTSEPVLTAEYAYGRAIPGETEWGLFDWGEADWGEPEPTESLEGAAPADVYGSGQYAWAVGKRVRSARFDFVCTQETSRAVLRQIEVFIRPSGRL